MKHMRFFFVLAMLATLLAFSSCRQEIEEPKVEELPLVDVSLDIVESKDLASNHDRAVECFVVSSKIVSATQKEFEVIGEFEGLKIAKGTGTAPATGVSLGKHTQGLWTFRVDAINKAGDIIYTGSVEKYISQGSTSGGISSVSVSLAPYTEGTGYLTINFFRSMAIADPRLVVEYQPINGTGWQTLLDSKGAMPRDFAYSSTSDGYMKYTAGTTQQITLPTGAYKLKVTLYNSDNVFSGEILDTYIFKGKTTNLAGTFSVSGYASFVVVDPGQKIKFTEAAEQIGIAEGKILTGFYMLGGDPSTSVTFNPYFTNTTSAPIYLMPMEANQSTYFNSSTTGSVVTVTAKDTSSLKYVAFSSTYASSPNIIGSSTFNGRTNLSAVYAPDVNSVENNAFTGSGIQDLAIQPLKKIGSDAFNNCTSLTECPKFDTGLDLGAGAFEGSGIGNVEIPSDLNGGKLADNAFRNCTNLRSVTVSTNKIGTETFRGCTGLTFLTLENTVEIEPRAFYGCSVLQTPVIPKTLNLIGSEAFRACSSMDGTISLPDSMGKNGSVVISDTTPIKSNAFYGTTNLDEIYIDLMYGEIDVSGIGNNTSTTPVTFRGYYVFFDANNPSDGTSYLAKFNSLTSKFGRTITAETENVLASNSHTASKIHYDESAGTYKYENNSNVSSSIANHPVVERTVAYNTQMGSTLDGYPLPIPTRKGFAFMGWYTSPNASEGTKYTDTTAFATRGNITLYAHWQEGVLSIIFDRGSNDQGTAGSMSETYRTVRYLENYGRKAGEDPSLDVYAPGTPSAMLPSPTVPGRTFIGWYFYAEPKMSNGKADEVDQAGMTEIISYNGAASVRTSVTDYNNIATSGAGSISSATRPTQWQVLTNEGHMLYAHYKDNRYTIQYNPQLPSSALTKESGTTYTSINGSHGVTGMSFPAKKVKNSYTLQTSWDDARLATDNSGIAYEGTADSLPDLNTSNWRLDNWYFNGWYYASSCTAVSEVSDSTVVAKTQYGQSANMANGTTINLYGAWVAAEVPIYLVTKTDRESGPVDLVRGTGNTSYLTSGQYGELDRYVSLNGTLSADATVAYYGQYGQTFRTVVNSSYLNPSSVAGVRNYISAISSRTTLPVLTRAGYTFGGWYTAANGGGTQIADANGLISASATISTAKYGYSGGSRVAQSITLYAKWTANSVTVTFNANGGSVATGSKTVTYTSTYGELGELPNATRTGYKFVGWFESTSRSEGFGFSQARVTGSSTVTTYTNHTLYAAWVSYEYTPGTTSSASSDGMSYSYTSSTRTGAMTFSPNSSGSYATSSKALTYTAEQVPTTRNKTAVSSLIKSRSSSSGQWTITQWAYDDSTPDYVSDGSLTWTSSNSGTNSGETQDPHIANSSTAWATKSNCSSYRSSALSSSQSGATWTFTVSAEKPGSRTITLYDSNYYGAKAASNAASPISGTTANSSARITYVTVSCYGDLTGITLSGSDSVKVQDTGVKYTAGFNGGSYYVHDSQRGLAQAGSEASPTSGWFITSRPTGDSSSYTYLSTNSAAYSKSLNVGYKTGKVKIKVISSFNTGLSAEKEVTITAPQNGSVSVSSGSSNAFTSVADKSIKGTGGSTARAIPTSSVVSGFYVYGSGSTTTVDFPYSQSTGHDVWLIPIDSTAASSTATDFQAPTGLKYIAYPAITKLKGQPVGGSSLKAVYIPKTVTTINDAEGSAEDYGTFTQSSNLVDLYIEPNGSTYNLTSIGSGAFYECSNTNLSFPNFTSVLTKVGTEAFYAANLTGSRTFNNCSIGSDALRGTKITTLAFTGSCTLGTYCCYNVDTITSLSLTGVTSLGSYAFAYCDGFTSVTVPAATTTMGTYCFEYCGGLTSCTVNCSTMGNYSFYYCTKLTSCTVNSSAVSSYAFYGCSKLTSISLGSSCTTINTYGFGSCTSLSSLTMPSTVTTIGSSAFRSCTGLSSVIFNETAAFTISNYAFYECTSLTTVDFLALNGNFKNMTMGSSVWYNCNIQYAKFKRSEFSESLGSATSSANTYYAKAPSYVMITWTNYKHKCSKCGDPGGSYANGSCTYNN